MSSPSLAYLPFTFLPSKRTLTHRERIRSIVNSPVLPSQWQWTANQAPETEETGRECGAVPGRRVPKVREKKEEEKQTREISRTHKSARGEEEGLKKCPQQLSTSAQRWRHSAYAAPVKRKCLATTDRRQRQWGMFVCFLFGISTYTSKGWDSLVVEALSMHRRLIGRIIWDRSASFVSPWPCMCQAATMVTDAICIFD